jgi:3-hydroxyisobutyrate dehydrogenase
MTSVAVLGIGRMGRPLADRLVAAGHRVTVWNRTPTRAADVAGATAAASPFEAVRGCGAVVTMLADPDAVTEVLFGADGAAPGLAPGTLVIEMSTIGPDTVATLRKRLPDTVGLVDAPVRGSVPQAEAGELDILVGGDPADVEAAGPVLAALGRVQPTGALGSAAALKLVVNACMIATVAAVGDALEVARRLGVDRTAALDALAPLGRAPGLVRARAGDGGTPTHFALDLALKDVALAAGGDHAGLGVLAATRDALWDAVAAGQGDRDFTVLAVR